MSLPAIEVSGLGKCYRIGLREELPDTLVGSLASWLTSPWSNFRRLRGLTRFEREEGEDIIWALREVSFQVAEGEVVGIVGKNGAGKSTLLKVLAGITSPTRGRAVIRGRISSLLEVGTGFHPELTGRENVYLNGAILGMTRKEIDRKFDQIVSFAEVERFIDTPVKRYSSGMAVRLAFAVAAHLEPEIMLVDEVLAVGDAAFQAKCLGKMQDVAGQGRTVLFVSHNMAAVNRLCSRALLLHQGRLVREGPTTEVTAAYLSGSFGGVGQEEWDEQESPGEGGVKLLGVRLTNSQGEPVAQAEVGDELHLTLRYRVEKPGLRFRCCATWYTQGTCAFSSVEPREEVRARPGIYSSTLVIPPHLLAEGEYSIMVSIFASRGIKSHYVRPRHVLMVQVSDPLRGDSARGDYAERLAGVLRPRLRWRLRREE